MEQKTCIKCGKPNPEYEPRFVAVNVISNSSTSYSGRKQITTTTTSERIIGPERCCACEDCIKKKRTADAVSAGLGGLLGGTIFPFIMSVFFLGKRFNDNAGTAFLVCLAIGVVVSVCVFIYQMKRDMPFIAEELLKKARKNAIVSPEQIRYIPVDPSLYLSKDKTHPDLEVFKSKTNLKTNIGTIIFTQFVLTGLGDALVDQMLLQQQTPAQPEAAQTTESTQPEESAPVT